MTTNMNNLAPQTAQQLLTALGSFWQHFFTSQGELQALLTGVDLTLGNAYHELYAAMATVGAATTPAATRQQWQQFTWRQSAVNVYANSYFKYGPTLSYGGGGTYGGVAASGAVVLPLPPQVTLGPSLVNRISEPSLILLRDRDWWQQAELLRFAVNPFTSDLVPRRNIIDQAGVVTDIEIALWAPTITLHEQALARRYAPLVGLWSTHGDAALHQLIQTILRLYTGGPKHDLVLAFLNAVFELPTTLRDSETVYSITADGTADYVATNRAVYRREWPALAKPLRVGEVLPPWFAFYHAVEIMDNRDQPGWWRNRQTFSIPTRLLRADYQSGLRIQPALQTVPVTVGATFPVTVAGTLTDAQLADWQAVPITLGLPMTVGATDLVVEQYTYLVGQIADNLLLIKINPVLVRCGSFTQDLVTILQRSLPTWSSYLLSLELDTLADNYDTTTIDETVTLNDGVTPSDTLVAGVDYTDGYYGLPRVDGGLPVGGAGFEVGMPIMAPWPYLQIKVKGSNCHA